MLNGALIRFMALARRIATDLAKQAMSTKRKSGGLKIVQ